MQLSEKNMHLVSYCCCDPAAKNWLLFELPLSWGSPAGAAQASLDISPLDLKPVKSALEISINDKIQL